MKRLIITVVTMCGVLFCMAQFSPPIDGTAIVDGSVTGADLATDIDISTTGSITSGAMTNSSLHVTGSLTVATNATIGGAARITDILADTNVVIRYRGGTGTIVGYGESALTNAWTTAQAGDLIKLGRGLYALDHSYVPTASGVTIEGSGPGAWNYTTDTIATTGTLIRAALALRGADTTIKNLGLTAHTDTTDRIFVGQTNEYMNVHLEDINIYGADTTSVHQLEVRGNYATLRRIKSYLGGHSIVLKVANSTAEDIYTYKPRSSGGYIKSDPSLEDVSNVVVRGWTILGDGTSTRGFSVEVGAGRTISDIDVQGVKTYGVDIGVAFKGSDASGTVNGARVLGCSDKNPWNGTSFRIGPLGTFTNIAFIGCSSVGSSTNSYWNWGSVTNTLLSCVSDGATITGPWNPRQVDATWWLTDLTVGGAITGATAHVTGSLTVATNATIGGAVTNSSTAHFVGDVTMAGTLGVTGAISYGSGYGWLFADPGGINIGPSTVTNALELAALDGSASFVASATIATNLTVGGDIEYGGQAYPSDVPTLTYAGTNVAWDVSSGNVGTLTLEGAWHLSAPSNVKAGATYILVVSQDGTGSRTLSYDAVFKWPGGTAPTITTAASSIDVLTFVASATNVLLGVSQQDFQ